MSGSSEAPARGAKAKPAKPPERPRELQDPLNYYLYHPLSWRLARLLVPSPLTPNMVSLIGAMFVVGAAFAYAQPWWPWSALLGQFLHMSWHVIDGADGDLARMTGRSSPTGEMVDGICDYASHIVLYVVLTLLLQDRIGWTAWLWGWGAGLSHIVQSNHVEVQRRSYQWWVYGVPWLNNTRRRREGMELRRGLGAVADLYLRVASGLTPHAKRIDAAVDAAAGDPTRLKSIRARVRGASPPLLRIVKLLGPNPRAIVLGASMLAGSPLYYFVYQAVVLNLLLVWSVFVHNRAAQRIAARIGS